MIANYLWRGVVLISLIFSFIGTTSSQDVIVTKEGREIECKVLEIALPNVKYRLQNQSDGPTRNMEAAKIFMIKYADGTKELFKEEQEKEEKDNGKIQEKTIAARNYKPFSISIGSGLELSDGRPQFSAMLGFGYEIEKINLRLYFDGIIVTNFYGALATFNLNLHYIFKVVEDKLEIFPELGVGILYFPGLSATVVNVGVGVDYRVSDLFSIYLHPRYQIVPVFRGGLFCINVGARFRFGGK